MNSTHRPKKNLGQNFLIDKHTQRKIIQACDLKTEDTVVEIAPLAGHALALSIAALIGIERPNQGWVDNYGKMAQNAWDEIAADLMRQQQHLTARLGSPNRNNQRRGGWAYPLQGNMGWEWRGFGLFLKLI